jgi:hypothetical protein
VEDAVADPVETWSALRFRWRLPLGRLASIYRMKRKEEAAIETSGGEAGDRGPVDQSPAMWET